MSATPDAQIEITERLIEHADLESALERRQVLKEQLSDLRRQYAEVDGAARTMIDEFALGENETARCGRFKILRRALPPRSVSFETGPATRTTILTLDV